MILCGIFYLFLQPRSASATCSSSCDNMLMENVASPDHRLVRSPRNRSSPNSAQNSPQRVDMLVSQDSPRPTMSGAGKINSGDPCCNHMINAP